MRSTRDSNSKNSPVKPPPKPRKTAAAAATAVKPKAEEHDIRAVLTARVDALLEKNRALEEELQQSRAENRALGRIVDRQERELQIMSAATEEKAAPAAEKPKKIKAPVKLGAVVFYTPPEAMNAPVAPALVIGSHDDDGTVDLRVNLGYCQGVTDVQRVKLEDEKAAKGKDGKPVPQHNTYTKEAPKDED